MTDGRSESLSHDLRYGIAASPIGLCFVATTARGLCALSFLDEPLTTSIGSAVTALRRHWPESAPYRDDNVAARLAAEIFAPGTRAPARQAVQLDLRGTPFDQRVWTALLTIPTGTTTTYGALARALGSPGASRAVGNAVGRNPVAVVVPCHRVVRSDGQLGGFRWGVARKITLLALERNTAPLDRE